MTATITLGSSIVCYVSDMFVCMMLLFVTFLFVGDWAPYYKL